MFCPKCGADLKDGAKFCSKCGTKTEGHSSEQLQKAEEAVTRVPAPEKKRKKKPGAMIIFLLIVLLLVVLGVGGGVIYYLNKSNDEAMLESIQAQYRDDGEEEPEESLEGVSEASLENESEELETLSAPTTAVPTEPIVQETTMAAELPVTAAVGYASEASLGGLVRAGMLMSTAYESSYVIQQDVTIDNTGWSAFDGQSTTSWQEGVEGDGIGEHVGISFDREYQVQVVTLLLGNHRSDSWYARNNTPQTLTINLSGKVYQVTFPKEKVEFAVTFSSPVAASDIRITIDSVYPGTEYTDSIIAEVGVYGY